jgi:chromate transporter
MPKLESSKQQSELTYLQLFLKFLRFGFLAWGGPVAQIALMHEEIVEREKWISEEKFTKVLAVYQALPGPEATELAVYFGYFKKGRLGGLLSGLGFILPGFFLVLIISYLYVTYGVDLAPAQAFLYGVKPAVIALIAVAIYKIGKGAITDRWLLLTAILTAAAYLLVPINLVLLLFICGVFYYLMMELSKLAKQKKQKLVAAAVAVAAPQLDRLIDIFIFFLKAGLLTFGGAYTVIPFVHDGAIGEFGWLTPQQFLDGIALSAIVPGPLIIVSTFVGFIAGGPAGAVIATFAVFLPAFAFTLVGFEYIQKIIHYPRLQTFLAGLTAGVVAVIFMSSIALAEAAIFDLFSLGVFALALIALWRYKANIAIVVGGAGLAGLAAKSFLGL